MSSIFSENFLSHYLPDFNLSSVVDVRGKILIIKELIKELETGKIESLKEEEIKSRFLNQFFGDVLGFNYGNSEHWMLREEKKSLIDGTKPDAVLGYCSIAKKEDDVRVVIEIKDANTNLEEKQNRKTNASPIEQAFNYVSKMGGNCKWVVISNIKEIRFYPSLDRSKYQSFFLTELEDDIKLKELLFLFHKDRFIKHHSPSPTDLLFEKIKNIKPKDDKGIHIIDKIYHSLKRFEDFGFVDPNYIANLEPFNILKDHVWHYKNRNLFTNNSEIYLLLSEISVENGKVSFSERLQLEVTEFNVVEAIQKIEWSFGFLNSSLINEISAIKNYHLMSLRRANTLGFSHRHHFSFQEGKDGVTKNINVIKDKTCDCLSCNYRTLDFDNVLKKLKVGSENDDCYTAEYAYGNYLVATNNFKTTYSIYKKIEKQIKGRQNKAVQYFLIKKNIRYLHNLVLDYQYEDSVEILNDIKSVDLDKIIYDEIEFDIDKEVRDYLIKVKEDDLIYKLQDEIDETIHEISKLKLLYKNGGWRQAGPNLEYDLIDKYVHLFFYINRNYIVYDIFKKYKSLSEKIFKGLIDHSSIPGINPLHFNEFILSEAFLHIGLGELQEILADVNEIKTTEGCIEKLLEKLNNYTRSYYTEGFFGTTFKNTLLVEQLSNHRFESKFTDLFNNMFVIFSRLNITKEQFHNSINSLLEFLKLEDELSWHQLKGLANFLQKKGDILNEEDLLEILKISITRDKYGFHKYHELIMQIPKSFSKFYPLYKLSNRKLVQTAILNCSSDDGDDTNYKHLIDLVNICDDNCRLILFTAFEEHLDKKFNCDLYETLLQKTTYDFRTKNYFQLYAEYVNKFKGGRPQTFGKNQLTDFLFMNFILVVYTRQIDFNIKELSVFTNLNDFETWLLNPIDFDYSKFEAKWLLDVYDLIIITRLTNNLNIEKAIAAELKKEFNPVLAELKYNYFKTTD